MCHQRCRDVDFEMRVTQDNTIVGAFLASGRSLRVARGRMRSAQIATGLRGCTRNLIIVLCAVLSLVAR